MTDKEEVKETKAMDDNSSLNQVEEDQPKINRKGGFHHWLLVSLYAILLLSGQTVGTLLGRLYFDKRGNSKWIGSLVQVAGFPIMLPYLCIPAPKKSTRKDNIHSSEPSASRKTFVYVILGLLEGLVCYLDALGIAYLPASTFSLITSSRLAFNVFFSFFLNSLKFTPYLINSVILLTISPILLVFRPDTIHSDENIKSYYYAVGFIATLGGSIAYGLFLSLTQVAFEKVLKKNTDKVLVNALIYGSTVATIFCVVGLFASGEWNDLKREFEVYEMGKVSYLLTVIFTTICWQVYNIGCMGLIFEVSALFSNAIIVVGVPLVPVMAVFIFHDKMHGIKAISLVLAVWGFISYAYQYYLDDKDPSNAENRNTDYDLKASTKEEINS